MTTKKEVVAVMQGKSHLSKIEYKGIIFCYLFNNLTIKECKDYINKRLSE